MPVDRAREARDPDRRACDGRARPAREPDRAACDEESVWAP
ncbi:hypothetical protein [Streptomyces sp. NPDC001719]